MTAWPTRPGHASPWLTADGWRRLFRDRPIIPLLVPARHPRRASASSSGRASSRRTGSARSSRAAVPLAILAGCQTLTMLTGGIDLSVGAVASMTGFVVATLVGGQGLGVGIIVALSVAALAGLVTGIGVGVFRVHPLIMTLGMGLVVLGFANVWQLQMVQTGAGVPPELRTLGRGHAAAGHPEQPARLRAARARSSCSACGGPATAGCCTRSATTRSPRACPAPARGRCSSCCTCSRRCWPAIAGFLHLRADQRRQRDPRRLATCCRRSRPRSSAGRRSWAAAAAIGGTIVGALILTVLTSLLTSLGLPGGGPPDPVRRDHRRRRGRLHARDRRDLTGASDAPSASRHLGLDLGGTNIKWAVVEHDARRRGGVVDRDQVPTPAADGPDAVVGRLAEVGRRGDRRGARASPRSGSASPGCTTRRRARRGSSSTSRGLGRRARWPGPVGDALGVPSALDQRRAGVRAGRAAARGRRAAPRR